MIVGTLWTNLAIQAITFATSVLTARILGPVGRGELALVLLYPQLIAVVALMGVDKAVAVLGGRRELARPIATITKLAFIISIPAVGFGYATLIWRVADAHLASLATIYLSYVPAMYFFLLVVALFNGTGDFARFNLTRLWFYVVNFFVVGIIWATAPTTLKLLDWVVWANLASVYAALAMAGWMLRGFTWSVVGDPTLVTSKGDMQLAFGLAASFAMPVMLAQFSGSVYQIILEHQLGVGPLGLFVVYFSYSRILSPFGGAINSHVFHLGIAGKNSDIVHIFRRSLLVYMGCLVPLWLVSGWLIPMIFGRDFLVNLWVLGFLFVSCLFALLGDNVAEYLNGQRKVGADTIGRLIYLVTVSALGIWLVGQQLGLVGMAIAMALGDILRCGYLVRRVSYEKGNNVGTFLLITWKDLAALIREGKEVVHEIFAWR